MRLVTMVVLDENERREIARVHRWIDIHPDADRPLARGRKVRELLSQTVYGLTDHAEPASRARIAQALEVLGQSATRRGLNPTPSTGSARAACRRRPRCSARLASKQCSTRRPLSTCSKVSERCYRASKDQNHDRSRRCQGKSRLDLRNEGRAVAARKLARTKSAHDCVVSLGVPAVGTALDSRLLRGGLPTRGH